MRPDAQQISNFAGIPDQPGLLLRTALSCCHPEMLLCQSSSEDDAGALGASALQLASLNTFIDTMMPEYLMGIDGPSEPACLTRVTAGHLGLRASIRARQCSHSVACAACTCAILR